MPGVQGGTCQKGIGVLHSEINLPMVPFPDCPGTKLAAAMGDVPVEKPKAGASPFQ
jgi:hypothetical protein